MTDLPPGWHPDPTGPPGRMRYWDGQTWTAHVAGQGGRVGPWAWIARHKLVSAVVAVTAIVAFGNLTDSSEADDAEGPGNGSAGQEAGDEGTRTDERTKERKKERHGAGDKAGERQSVAPQPEPTYLVSSVVDGDTVDLANGETVRLVGIDTPEVGECGYDKARERLVALVEGERVTLVRSDEDRDRYGRLLRYVDLGPVDAGRQLLADGFAIARYDSRDGYGFHPREPEYIREDRGAPNVKCHEPRHFTPQQPPGCADGYSPCVPAYPPDVDCADVDGPISVTGSDPHGLDADDDGVACE